MNLHYKFCSVIKPMTKSSYEFYIPKIYTYFIKIKMILAAVGFEPTPTNRLVP